MATLYTRIYTYKKQTKWTYEDRQAAWSQFTVTGDTDKSIVHIVSIQYEHYNQSYDTLTWSLKGALVLSDGTIIYSDTVSKTIGYSTKTLFVNTFTTLPTVTQFNNISYIRTYGSTNDISGGYTEDSTDRELTWRADSSYPMRVIVTYYDEEPLVYKPTIEKFEVVRGIAGSSIYTTGTRNDNGTDALFTVQLSAQNRTTSLDSGATVYLYYSTGTVTEASTRIDMSSYFTSYLLSGITDAEISTSITVAGDEDYNFLLVFTYGGESIRARTSLSNTFVALHISGCSTGGVSIGDISSATENNPKFEVHHPSYLYGGIAQIGNATKLMNGFGMYCGISGTVTLPSDEKNGTITFGVEFNQPPLVFLTPVYTGYKDDSRMMFGIIDTTTTSCTIRVYNPGDSGDTTMKFNWLAIDPNNITNNESGNIEGDGGTTDGDDSGGTTVGTTAIKSISKSGNTLSSIMTDDTNGSSVTLYGYGTSLPTSGYTTGDLFFLI